MKQRSGDNDAFNGLVLEYQETLYRIAKSRLNCDDDICDVVQNTLISAYKSINTLQNEKYFKTWLIKILINKCNTFYAKSMKENISFEVLEDNKIFVEKDFTNDFSIDYLINSLSNDEQTILTLFYVEGYSEKEISKILGMNYATVRTRIKRAKEKIALKLDKEEV
ncbi:MAG: RNA polymerase sigma factor [Clostridia bacterium]|nr:RNA polymerase sigma factor [Clostridia bacterium]